MATCGWTSAQIRTNLSERIKKMIQDKIDPSITNSTQFLDLAVREALTKLEAKAVK